MYISNKFKCQLSFNWHLKLSKVWATQSRTGYYISSHWQRVFKRYIFTCTINDLSWENGYLLAISHRSDARDTRCDEKFISSKT